MTNKIIRNLFNINPTNRTELLVIIKEAAENKIFDIDSVEFIEAAIRFGDMRAKDILLPRHEVDFIDVNSDADELLHVIRETRHSRFPVVDGDLNNVIGVFHSKDIVELVLNQSSFQLSDYCRKAFFVPDLKPLDSLLYEMRLKQTHLAIVVDEFTNVVGIITLEMIIEQIVGEINDEHDFASDEHSIVEVEPNVFRVKGFCGLEMFNEKTGLLWHDKYVESVGGYIIKNIGFLPSSGEVFTVDNINIEIVNSDSRKINTILLRSV